MLGKRPVPGRPTDLDNSRALAVGTDRGGLDFFSLVYTEAEKGPFV